MPLSDEDKEVSSVTGFPCCPLPATHSCATHQAVPSDVEEVEAVHAEADVLPVGDDGHHRLGVVPWYIMVHVP